MLAAVGNRLRLGRRTLGKSVCTSPNQGAFLTRMCSEVAKKENGGSRTVERKAYQRHEDGKK